MVDVRPTHKQRPIHTAYKHLASHIIIIYLSIFADDDCEWWRAATSIWCSQYLGRYTHSCHSCLVDAIRWTTIYVAAAHSRAICEYKLENCFVFFGKGQYRTIASQPTDRRTVIVFRRQSQTWRTASQTARQLTVQTSSSSKQRRTVIRANCDVSANGEWHFCKSLSLSLSGCVRGDKRNVCCCIAMSRRRRHSA